MEDQYTYEYLPFRGVTSETFKFYDVRTKVDPEGKPVSLGFIYPDGSTKVRSLLEKTFYSVGTTQPGLFGYNCYAAGVHKYVIITEGELDACSLYQVLHRNYSVPVVSVHSAQSASRDCAAVRSWLNSFERIYLAFDDDEPGRTAAAAVARLFDYNKVFQLKFRPYKDANDYLQKGEEDNLRNIWINAKRYQPSNIVSSLSDFKEILTKPLNHGISYPWPTLTKMTYGIRKSESVLLTAQEGVGKTELLHAIEYHLLTRTQENIGAIYLEEPKDRHLQALAGLDLKRPVHLPDSGVSSADIFKSVEKTVGMDHRLHLYSHFGSDDGDTILDTIRFLVTVDNCSYILFDHITMAVSGLQGEDERRALDYIATRLEMMVKELNFALLIVSHVNDLGQTRGSRYISKIADIRIDCVRDLLHPDDTIRNSTYLSISKNRFSGRTGQAGRLLFDPLTYTLTEVEAANDNLRHSREDQRAPTSVEEGKENYQEAGTGSRKAA